MTAKAYEVIQKLQGRTLAVAESCTGGMIGAALTEVPGASAVFKGGIVSYTNEVKENVLGVRRETLDCFGAVSAQTAEEMASGAAKLLKADAAVSVTGLAGPGGDTFGNPVGTVFVGYSDKFHAFSREFHFSGGRGEVRRQAVEAALEMILSQIS